MEFPGCASSVAVLLTFLVLTDPFPGLALPTSQLNRAIVPPPFHDDTVEAKLNRVYEAVENQQFRAKRDVGSYQAGRLFSLVNVILSLLAALQSQQATTTAFPTEPLPDGETPAPTPPTPAPPSSGIDPLVLAQILALAGGFGGGGRGSDDASELAVGYDHANEEAPKCSHVGTLCHPETKILNLIPFPDHILALGKYKTFRVDLNGKGLDIVGTPREETLRSLNGTPTAALRVAHLHYIFYGKNVTLLSNESAIMAPSTANENVFFKITQPIRGAFRFNDHTLTLFLDRHFVFYQPLANPPVDPRFSPQPIYIVPGGPDDIDGAMEINNTKYLYRAGWLYEIAADEMQVKNKFPLRKTLVSGPGFINCVGFRPCKLDKL